jgi:hypothetical protein
LSDTTRWIVTPARPKEGEARHRRSRMARHDTMRTIRRFIAILSLSLASVTLAPGAAAMASVTDGCGASQRSGKRAVGCPAHSAANRLFAPDSVWNQPVDVRARLDPTSTARMASLNAEINSEIARGIGPWISETSYSTPLYRVPASQPKVRVTLDTGSWGAPLRAALHVGVPIPRDARPAAGTDGHLTVWQPSTDTLWEFWKAVRRGDGWHASWGGAMQHVSRNPGYYSADSWKGLAAPAGWNWGSTATSLPVIAGTILIDELRRGRIDHALALAIPDACAGTFSWPAQRTDGGDPTATCLPEGAHLRLDPTLDLSTLSLPPITRVLAEAAQRYGMIVRDRTHHAVGLYAEDPTRTGSDPYVGSDGLYGGLRPWNFLPQFPWDRLQLLKMRLCRQAPCLLARSARSRPR